MLQSCSEMHAVERQRQDTVPWEHKPCSRLLGCGSMVQDMPASSSDRGLSVSSY